MMSCSLSLALLAFVLAVSVSEANYQFTIRFYEFHNPLGLQCGECESGGPPACCDDVQRKENCISIAPYTCDTRFRFILRPFGAPVETAPSGGFPYLTPSNSGNSGIFNEGPGRFLALPNPFSINSTSEWTGRIQFFIDALDRAAQSGETEVLINRFPINLELELGANFTERTTYIGHYNISSLGFDMSFRVQCSENYYGPYCTTLCEALEEVYTCNSEGKRICLLQRGLDPVKNCTTCLPEWEPKTNCTTCFSPFYDIQTDCTQCLPGRDITSHCNTCLPGYDLSTDCTTCLPDFDPSTSCAQCLAHRDITTNYYFSHSADSVVTPAILGGILGLSTIINVILIIVVVVLATKIRGTSNSLFLQPPLREGEGEKRTMDIEMKPNSLYGLTSGSESIVTKPNEVYGISVPAEPSHLATYDYVKP